MVLAVVVVAAVNAKGKSRESSKQKKSDESSSLSQRAVLVSKCGRSATCVCACRDKVVAMVIDLLASLLYAIRPRIVFLIQDDILPLPKPKARHGFLPAVMPSPQSTA